MSTVKAAFGGWVPLVNLDECSSIPGGFVLKLSDELRPTHVADGFCQAVVLDHILDRETLDTYDLVFAYDISRELLLVVSSAVCNLFMDASNLQTSFCTVLRTFFLFCVTALRCSQLLFLFGEELGIAVGLPIGGDDHRFQTQVKPYHLRRDWEWLDVLFYQDGDEVAVSLIFSDGDTTWLASIGQGAMPNDGKRSIHLGKRENLPIPGKGVSRIGSRLLIAFLFEGGIVSTSFKEVAKAFIQMPERLLKHNRRHIIEPNRLFLLLERDQALCCPFVVQTLTMLVVCVSTLSQCPVVDIAATPEGLCQDALLFIAWIEAVLVGSLLFHTLQYSTCAVKCRAVSPAHHAPKRNAPYIPRAEAQGFTARFDKEATLCQVRKTKSTGKQSW